MTLSLRSRLPHLVACPILVLLIALSSDITLAAGEDASAAKAHFAAGLQHFNLSEYEQALAEFKDGYRNKPDPVFLFNIGQCHRKLGHVEEAITFYRSYLREAPNAENRKDVERRIEELESLRDAQNASIASSAGTSPHSSPTSQAAQNRAVVDIAVVPPAVGVDISPRDEAPASSAGPIYKRWWVWAAMGAVVVGTAAVAIVMARRDPTEIPASSLGAQRALP